MARGLQDRTGRLELYYLNAGYAEALAQLGSSSDALAAINRALDVARSISNPCLIVQGLGVRAGLPDGDSSPIRRRYSADLAEQASLCRQYGLVADEQLRASLASPAGQLTNRVDSPMFTCANFLSSPRGARDLLQALQPPCRLEALR